MKANRPFVRAIVLAAAMTCLLCGRPAAAQSRPVYVAAGAAAETGGRGDVDIEVLGAVGIVAGLRLSEAWSVEFGVDQGIGRSGHRVSEGLLLAQLNHIGTREEREHFGVFGRTVWSSSPGPGYSVLAVWKTRDAGRLNAALFGGFSMRRYERRTVRTITSVGPGVTYPPDHPNLQNADERIPTPGGGLTGGFMIPIRMTPTLHLAPDIRFTFGRMSNASVYRVLHTGVRLLWGF